MNTADRIDRIRARFVDRPCLEGAKDDLVIAFLEQREQLWTKDWVEAEARRRGSTPEEQLLAIFDLFNEWFQRDDFEGCSFVNVLLEFGGRNGHRLGRASADHLENIRSVVARSPRKRPSAI